MSSSRANAAARQRRAGDTPSTPQQSSYNSTGSKTRFVQQQQEPPQPPMNPKLSISDAIALITLRLGRVENIVSNYDPNAGSNSGNHQMNYDENARMVDEEVFNSIVSRLDALEKGRNVGGQAVGNPQLEQRLSVLEKNQKMLIEKQQQMPVVGSSTETTIVNDVTEEKLKPIEYDINFLKSELSELKLVLLKLQSFTMETNQKLANIVFEDRSEALNNAFMMSLHNSGFNMDMDMGEGIQILDGDNENDTGIEVDEGIEIMDEVKHTIQSTNLKELVKQELMNQEEGASAML
jgi:hypothetical protein